jgi:hypothetical protein
MEIRTKTEFFRLWNAGALGFKLRTWDNVEDAIASGVALVGFRQIGTAGGGRFEMATPSTMRDVAARWRADGITFMVCEAAPDEKGTIQGEVCRGLRGWEGYLGPVIDGRRMRDSLRDGHIKPRSASETLVMVNTFMSAPSRDDLDALLELYPDATIEFTCYGDHDFDGHGRNTIFWEVRNY